MLTLSHRLQTICDMVTPGLRICDVGCDHAYVDIRLLQEGKVPSALAMDVADGPLATAAANLELTELSDRCITRKSNGLAAYEPGEADCMICAGMGGILMRSLLEAEPDKVRSFRELILSPQSEIHLVREWLFAGGFRIADEKFLTDEGKYYTVMKVLVPDSGEQERPDWDGLLAWVRSLPESTLREALVDRQELVRILQDPGFREMTEKTYGPCILHRFLEERKEPCFGKFLMEGLRSRRAIAKKLSAAAAGEAGRKESENAAWRLQEIRGEIGIYQVLLAVPMLRQIHQE